jgi:hypothetical protein
MAGSCQPDLNNEAPIAVQKSVKYDEVDRPQSPHSMHSTYSSQPALSEPDWGSDTASIHSVDDLLLYDCPPPPYSDADNNTTPSFWHTLVGKHSNNGSILLFGLPRSRVDVDSDADRPYNTCNQGRNRCGRFRKCCHRIRDAIIILGVVMLLGVTCAVFKKLFLNWARVCRTEGFITRDYQIQNLDYFDFSPTDEQNSGIPKDFSGIVHILSGPSTQSVDLNVSVRSTTSDLCGGTADAAWRPSTLDSCAEVAFYFRPGLEISDLSISATRVKLTLSTNLILTNTASISLKKGNLVSKHFDSSRQTYIDLQSSTASGTFGLRDLLSIKKQSGSMSIDVNPKPALKDRSRPAVLKIDQKSGAIRINYPGDISDIPNRQYHTTISSRSGSVSGKILHGKETVMDIRSGSLDVKVLPFAVDRSSSTLTTKLESGSMTIGLLGYSRYYKGSLTRLSSSHRMTSGHLRLNYPDNWEGNIYGFVRSGSFKLKGSDVKVIDQKSQGSNRYVHARKGHDRNKLQFNARSGNIEATVGS